MVSYIKTQWWRLLIALFCFVVSCIYALQPAGDPTTIEGLNQDLVNMVSAGIYFVSFILWSVISFIDYNTKRIQLLEAKQERDDKMYELVQELVEANKIDREYIKNLEAKIKILEGIKK
jgi:hypothetical protein